MERYDLILTNVARHISINAEDRRLFTSLLRTKKFSAGSFLLRQGEDCTWFYFVVTGTLRACFTDKKNRESTIMFALPDWWITDMYCFLNACPAMMHIEALTDSEVLQIGRNDLENLYNKVPAFERYFRVLMQNAYTREQLRVIENLSLPAIDRYNSFLQKYPLAAERITQKQLASYLGISPEFLSTIKGKKSAGS